MKISVPKSRKLDILSTYGPLNLVLRIFNLSCVYIDGAEVKWSWSVWKVSLIIISFTIINIITVHCKVTSFQIGSTTLTFKEAFQIAYLIGSQQYFIDLISSYIYGRQQYVDYINIYEHIDEIIGMHYYKKIKNSIKNLCIAFITIGVVAMILDCIAWSVTFDSNIQIMYLIDYLYIVLKMLSTLNMISNYIQMWYRLMALADNLGAYYCRCENTPSIIKDIVSLTESRENRFNGLKPVILNQNNIITELTRCYLLLIEQCDYLNRTYGIRIIINSVTFLLDMVMMLNLLIRLTMGTLEVTEGAELIPAISTIIRIFGITFVVITAIYRCEQSYRQNERILRLVDHLLLVKKIPSEIREALKQLKCLILSKPVKFHALNFYKLEYPVLVSMSSVIVTYTIILLQNIQ